VADVAIARYDVATGWLPAVCPKHGVPADRATKRKYYGVTPAWVYFTILLGLLPFALIQMSVRKSDDVTLPACGSCHEAKRRLLFIRIGTPLAGVVIFVLGAVLGSGGLAALSLLFVIAALLSISSLADPLTGVGGTIDDHWLRLRGVHDAFVAALRPNPAWQPQGPQLFPAQPQYAAAPIYAAAPPYGGTQCAVPPASWQPPYQGS
jgi:hypothetical protein